MTIQYLKSIRGNVLATVSDRKIDSTYSSGLVTLYTSDIRSATDYYAFGWEKPGRSFSGDKYAYGMNTQLKDYDYTQGTTSAMYWEYDSRVGQRRERDPKLTIGVSDYSAFGSNPLTNTDVMGDEAKTKNKGEKIVDKKDASGRTEVYFKEGEGKSEKSTYSKIIQGIEKFQDKVVSKINESTKPLHNSFNEFDKYVGVVKGDVANNGYTSRSEFLRTADRIDNFGNGMQKGGLFLEGTGIGYLPGSQLYKVGGYVSNFSIALKIGQAVKDRDIKESIKQVMQFGLSEGIGAVLTKTFPNDAIRKKATEQLITDAINKANE